MTFGSARRWVCLGVLSLFFIRLPQNRSDGNMAAGHTISNISYHTFLCSATPRRKRKFAAKRHFFAKGAQTGAAAQIDKIAGTECTMQIPQQVWRSNDETVYGRRQSAPSAQKGHRSRCRPSTAWWTRTSPARIFLRRSMRPNPRCTAAARSFSRGTSSTACVTASSTATRTKRSRTLRRRSSAFEHGLSRR